MVKRILCALCLLLSGGYAQPIRDIIPTINLIAGGSDSLKISNLFYLPSYPLKFQSDTMMSVEFHPSSLYLVIKTNAQAEGWYSLTFTVHNRSYIIPVRVQVRSMHTFSYQSSDPVKQIMVFGSFNSWNRNELAMAYQDGQWRTQVMIDPGRYEYKFLIDGQEKIDPANPEKVPNPFGDFNSILTINPRHSEHAYLHLEGYNPQEEKVGIVFYYTIDGRSHNLDDGDILALIDNERLDRSQLKIKDNRLTITLSRAQIDSAQILRVAVTQFEAFTPGKVHPQAGSANQSGVTSRNGLSSLMQTVCLSQFRATSHQTGAISQVGSTSQIASFWQDAIIYSIMIDRFMDGDSLNNHPINHPALLKPANFQGGDLRGIIRQIQSGYFDSLDINVLWISPVNQNTVKAEQEYPEPHRYFSGYHGYWPSEPYQVDTRFGSMDDLKELVNLAHKHGIRILLDFVAHHVHQDHPFFQHHPEWFGKLDLPGGRKNLRLWDEYRLTTWFEPYLPSFDFVTSHEALESMTDNAVWWLKETGIDGFRHDAVKHIPNQFWEVLTRKIREQIELPQVGSTHPGKSIYQIGETFGSYELISSYVNNGQLDAQFNFNLFFTARNTFLTPEIPLSIVNDEMQKTFQVYGMNHLMGNLMDSHDQIRYMALADGDLKLDSPDAQEIAWSNPPQVDYLQSYTKVELFIAYMLTIPGVPVIYYGDEIGMTGSADPDNRRMMKFNPGLKPAENQLRLNISKLCAIRRNHPALTRGDFYTIWSDQSSWVYLRSDFSERVMVGLNKSPVNQTLDLTLPEFYRYLKATNLIDGTSVEIRNRELHITLPPYGYALFQLR